MEQCITTPAAPQAPPFPVVSHRLTVMRAAALDAKRHGINPEPAIQAALAEYRATRGDHFAARRAAFATVDLQCGRGGRRYGA